MSTPAMVQLLLAPSDGWHAPRVEVGYDASGRVVAVHRYDAFNEWEGPSAPHDAIRLAPVCITRREYRRWRSVRP